MSDEPTIERTEYPPGIPCLIDTERPDPAAAAAFYGEVFGWTLEDQMPPGSDHHELVSLRGLDVADVASPPGITGPPTWDTYVSVAAAAAAVARAAELGADVHLETADAAAAAAFYGAVFGWQADDLGDGNGFLWRLPGYGDFLAIADPDIHERNDQPWVPPGFADAIGWMTERPVPAPEWRVTIGVDDTDDVVKRAERLGATVLSPPTDSFGGVVRTATIEDPQGAVLNIGSYDPSAAS